MEPACAADLLQFLAQLGHAIPDQAPVGLNLGLAGTSEETEAATLPFKVGPAPHQPALLIIEMRQFDLQPPLGGRCALAEDFEDQPGTIDHLGGERLLQIALLDRRDRGIDDDERRLLHAHLLGELLDLARTEQRRRLGRAQAETDLVDHIQPDRGGETCCLVQSGLHRSVMPTDVGERDDRAGAPRDTVARTASEPAQAASASSSPSSARLTGWSGWSVEIACL